MSSIADLRYLEDQLTELKAEREYMDDNVANRKQYWVGLRHPRDGELRWDLWNYVPFAHYDRAIEETRERLGKEVRTDGGIRKTQYFWIDPQSGAALYHTGVYDDEADPFFDTVEDAESFLEQQADAAEETERYEGMSLYKARLKKEKDAVEVLLEQSGIGDFAPDGGHQIQNPTPDRIWFWYDPVSDYILQTEVEPYDVRGVFDTKKEAYRFLAWYANQTDLDDSSSLELYSAELQYEGQGPETTVNPDIDGEWNPPTQADFDHYRSIVPKEPTER